MISHKNTPEVIASLQRCKVPMVLKTSYENGKPIKSEWLPNRCTKTDRFFRINGKVVSKNMAMWAMRSGVVEFSA